MDIKYLKQDDRLDDAKKWKEMPVGGCIAERETPGCCLFIKCLALL